jgi:sugar phosphate isomerase/epimerase
LAEIVRAAQQAPALVVIIEPLDVAAHKRQTLGFTAEAVRLLYRLRAVGLEVGLCLDTAHLLLNGEDPVENFAHTWELIVELHVCNCVTEPNHALYGDRHLPFGPPGVMDVATTAQILKELRPERRLPVFCEVLKRETDSSEAVMAHCRNHLLIAWELAVASMGRDDPPPKTNII